ncbi:MAG: hypothetical protein QOG03_1594 [Actinomycetota bacterium]|nr:hypothetical protein [Actinomycetota bacterium]
MRNRHVQGSLGVRWPAAGRAAQGIGAPTPRPRRPSDRARGRHRRAAGSRRRGGRADPAPPRPHERVARLPRSALARGLVVQRTATADHRRAPAPTDVGRPRAPPRTTSPGHLHRRPPPLWADEARGPARPPAPRRLRHRLPGSDPGAVRRHGLRGRAGTGPPHQAGRLRARHAVAAPRQPTPSRPLPARGPRGVVPGRQALRPRGATQGRRRRRHDRYMRSSSCCFLVSNSACEITPRWRSSSSFSSCSGTDSSWRPAMRSASRPFDRSISA